MTDVTQNQDTPVTSTQAAPPAQHPTDGANSGSSNGATLTQEEVNKLVGKARTEGKQTAVTDLLKTLGVASADDLKALIEDTRKRKESEMTESQKLQAERDKVAKERDDAIAERDRIQAERRNDKISSYLQTEAGKMKATDAETVLLYAQQKHQDALNAIMAEDGTLDEGKAKKLLETIKAEKPVYFVAVLQGAGVPSNSGGRATLDTSADAMKRASALNQRIIRG